MTRPRGFTLIELAIVLVIVTILIGGLAMPLSAQIQARRIAETKKTLEEAREAIIGYAMSNSVNVSPSTTCTCVYTDDNTLNTPDIPLDTSDDPDSTCPAALCPTSYIASATMTLTPPIARHYLPCPDLMENDPEPNLDNDDDGSLRDLNNGREDRYKASGKIGECASRSGNLPWVTLGAGQQDAWGNHLRYVVAKDFANGTTGLPAPAPPPDPDPAADIEICSSSDCPPNTHVADKIVAAIISHGPNGWGARSFHGTLLKNPVSLDELQNINTNKINDKTRLVSRSPYKPADNSKEEKEKEFDDLVVWISAGQLRGRVCPAGGCP